MYSTCLFCKNDLGRNEALEDFPVGRRIAFDPAKGRLWVVCRQCERWNLSPLEERWEAIEQAERIFSDTRQRVSTENIGLARLRDGTELVRIGAPMRPEFAAWRYGDQFGRRRRRQMLFTAAGIGALGAVVAGGAMAGFSVVAFSGLIFNGINFIVVGRPGQVVTHVRTETKGIVAVRRRHLAETRLARGSDAPLAIDLRFKGGHARIEGREAMRIAAALIPHVNRYGAREKAVQSAVGMLESAGGVDGYLDRLSTQVSVETAVPIQQNAKSNPDRLSRSAIYLNGLFSLSAPDRLALEMALHEEAELRAMHGELSELEQAWRDAEEIAAIADGILTQPSLESRLDQLRRTD